MIQDLDSSVVYLSDLLEIQCPDFYGQLISGFDRVDIKYEILRGTNDLWVRDFMPIQVTDHFFVQYRYDPDYLRPKKYQKTKSDSENLVKTLGIRADRVNILLDGGNVVKSKSKVIVTSKVFKENPDYPAQDLIEEIKNQLQIKQVIIIPQEPGDIFGHADGMVRFANENTVLVNQYPKNKVYLEFDYALRCGLMKAGLGIIDLPYISWQNRDSIDATGCYINFLEIGNCIFYPVYMQLSDQIAAIVLRNAFSNRELIGIDCRELAKLGGVLNCATWNIRRCQLTSDVLTTNLS